jgi:predicted AAA+ superfamily ATPase
MPASSLLPRDLTARLRRALGAFPAVVVTGARQTGKSTLVRELLGDPDRLYVTLDDVDVLDQAERAPDELVRRAPRMTLDEVQRLPDLLLAVKRTVDVRREPGRFILTGSADLLLMERVSESLAGRAAYLNLRPLTRREQLGLATAGSWERLFEEPVSVWRDLVQSDAAGSEPWQSLAARGGYPVPTVQLRDPEDRRLWFETYVHTYLERDLRQLAAVQHLTDYRRLMRAVCLRLGNLLNQADLARDVGLPPSTAQRYLNLMETSLQLVRLEPYAVNRTKRLIKSPKLFWTDTGLAMWVAGEQEPRGAHLENVVLNDLLAWRETCPDRPGVFFWRTARGAEVDFVIERGDRVLPVEVKAAARVSYADARHLRVFLEEYSDLAKGGLVLYAGEDVFWIADRILAVPWWRVI